ncbi:hypothetical protein GCM10009863_04430 [Streptomyces axinellae]|uniref:Uncharacterized protein n=1 Tax=Streptomyces axinellae TaxID=552788 RepID=A0ABN3PMX8_9ACTN
MPRARRDFPEPASGPAVRGGPGGRTAGPAAQGCTGGAARGRGCTDTGAVAGYMGEQDPFVRRQVGRTSPVSHPSVRTGRNGPFARPEEPPPTCAPWGMRVGQNDRGGAFLQHTRRRVAHHLANPGEPWRMLAGPLR